MRATMGRIALMTRAFLVPKSFLAMLLSKGILPPRAKRGEAIN